MNPTRAVLAAVAVAAVFSLAVAPIGYAYASPGSAPAEADGADGAHDGEYGEGGTCPFKNRQGASPTPAAWQSF